MTTVASWRVGGEAEETDSSLPPFWMVVLFVVRHGVRMIDGEQRESMEMLMKSETKRRYCSSGTTLTEEAGGRCVWPEV